MEKYEVVGAIVVDEKAHIAGEVVELDSNSDVTKEWLKNEFIKLYVAPIPEVKKLIKYEVVNGPIADPEGETFQTGNIIMRDEGDAFAEGMLTAGIIKVYGTEAPAGGAAAAAPLQAPVETDAGGEPRKRYRGHVVLIDDMRTVGTQTFHHIRCDDGAEYDLTALEYKSEVKMAYPPEK